MPKEREAAMIEKKKNPRKQLKPAGSSIIREKSQCW